MQSDAVERNRELEQELLFLASNNPTYRQQVVARLDKFEEDDGGNPKGWNQPVDKIAVEAQEEAADISGWLLGAALQLDQEQFGRLIAAMRYANWAYEQIEELRLELATG